MAQFRVVQTGGKQYLVKENDVIVVDKIEGKPADKVELSTIASFDDAGTAVELGSPTIKTATKAEIVEHVKGDKIRVAKFRAKVRYRRVTGFRPQLTKLKILA